MKLNMENFGPYGTVSLDFDYRNGNPKRLIAIYGQNGSGKTQLCKALEFLPEVTMTCNVQGLACKHSTYREVSRGAKRKGAEGDMSLTYTFDVKGRSITYKVIFDDDGELLSEQLHDDYGSADGFDYFRYDKAVNSEKPDEMGVLPRYCNTSSVNRILMENINDHTFLSTLLLYPGLKNLIREDLREILNDLDRMILPKRYYGGPIGDWCYGQINAGDVEVLKARADVIAHILKESDKTITGVRYEISETPEGTVCSGTVSYYLVVSRMVEGVEVDNHIEYEGDGIRHLVSILPKIIPSTSWRMAVVDDFDTDLGEALTTELIDQLSSQINGQLVVSLKTAEPLRNLDPRCVYIIDMDENGHRSVMTVSDRITTGKTNNNAARFRDGKLGGSPNIGRIDFDLVFNRLRE